MKKAIISPSPLCGKITAPPSKSEAHRAIICAALAKGRSVIKNIALSDDILATIGAVKALGAEIREENGTLFIDSSKIFSAKNALIDCYESGSTLRFMLSIAAAGGVSCTFSGRGRLPERPLGELTALLRSHGVNCSADSLPLNIEGKLEGGVYKIRGNVSSQYISGLLMALPLCEKESEIVLITPLESSGYVEMTVSVLEKFGIEIIKTQSGWRVPAPQKYQPREYTVEGDWSQAAFFLAAGAMGGNIEISGLKADSKQGDRRIFDILSEMGADISISGGLVICKASRLHRVNINASQIPDLVPILAVLLAFSDGEGKITNAERLRIKESNRLYATVCGLNNTGIAARESEDGILFPQKADFAPCEINGFGDHRIVMAFAVAAAYAKGEITIAGAQSIDKSYPDFWEDYKSLGGKANVINLWQGS